MGYRERRARRREWLAREQEAVERWQAERWARKTERWVRNEPRRELWSSIWREARPVLRVMMPLIALAVCGALVF
jgi:hypothetical protein